MVAPFINYITASPLRDIIFREVTNNNIPHVLITRNKDELVDQAISQFGNSTAFFGTGLLLDRALDQAPKLLKTPLEGAAKDWFHFGKAASIFSMISAVVLATPALRNYITTRRTKTNNFAEMIGEKSRTGMTDDTLRQKLAHEKNRFLKTLGVGAGISTALFTAGIAGMRSGKALPKALKKLDELIGLKDGQFKNFRAQSAVLFWVVPTFSGFLASARDKYEVKELALRFAAFNLAFFVFPMTIEKAIDNLATKMKPTKLLGSSKNLAYVGKYVSSLLFCTSIPTFINIYYSGG